MSKTTAQFTIRLPEEMILWLERKAEESHRSRNGVIVHVLSNEIKKEDEIKAGNSKSQ